VKGASPGSGVPRRSAQVLEETVVTPVSGPGARMARVLRVARPGFNPKGGRMFYWAAVFLIIAVIAAVLGLGGIAGVSANIAWILFIVGLILAVVFFVFGRRGRGL
jgi:uncharacterized membrane protein YtjA (UPF0391 family)